MKFLTGKDYPHLCPACRETVSNVAQLLAEAGPDTDDEEAPIMHVGDNRMFCGQHTCLDSEYKFRGVRKILDMLKHSESSVAAIKLAREHNPDRTLEEIADLVRELKAEYQIEDKAPTVFKVAMADETAERVPLSVWPVATYEIITAWLDNLVAFGKIVEVQDGAIRQADVEELNASLLAELRRRNPDVEIEEV